MAHRKNTKRIDPRYFLNETVNRNDDGSPLEEGADQIGPWRDRRDRGSKHPALATTATMPAVGRPDPEDEVPELPDSAWDTSDRPPGWKFKEFQDWLYPPSWKKEELEEGCPLEEPGEDGAAIDISAPGTEVHVDDISQLAPEEAFAAGMAAARDAIDQVMGAPDGPPPEGGFSGPGPFGEPAAEEE